MPLNEQSQEILLVFRIGPDKFHAFSIVAWKARSEHIVEYKDSSLVCDCQRFRFESECPHGAVIDRTCWHFVYSSDSWQKHEKSIDWKSHNLKFVGVGNETRDYPGVLHPEVGDLSAYDLIALLTLSAPTPDLLAKRNTPSSFLNPERIYAELKVSTDKGISLLDAIVKDAGSTIPKLTKNDVELDDDFDEALTSSDVTVVSGGMALSPPSQGIPIDWKTVKRPRPESFYVRPDAWDQIIYTMAHGGNVLVTGPSGSGKSELAYIAARATNQTIAVFNFGAMQDPRTSLIGATHFDIAKGTFTNMSRFAKAVSADRGVVLLDELSRDRGANAHNIILTLLDRQGYMSLDEHEDSPIIHKGAGVSFIATANIGMEYTGTEALDKALRDRMDCIIDMDFPPKEYEVKILLFRCPGLRAGNASKLVDIAVRQRDMAENDGEFTERVSTRMLLSAGTRIGNGMDADAAVKFCIVNHFSNEGGDASERTKLCQIVQKGGQ